MFSIILYIDTFIIAFIMSLCEGMQPALSYNYAKRDKARLKSLIFYIFATAFLLCFGVVIAIMLWSESLITLFAEKTNQDFIVFSAFALSLYALNYCITWFNVCVSSFLTAFNKASYSLLLSLMQGFFAPLCSLFVLTYLFGLNGIWCAAFVGDLLCVALSFALLKRAFILVNPYFA
ncbi:MULTISPECIES: MATE family efflux transporter [Helicobacter]|uniref:MATE family efflux transporter n=1 Tax=Helicobacter TaxID=209 RepID=UPI0022A728F1|nr:MULTISPECIES: MATE family efflux transporter [Helicobacter]